MNGVNAFVPFPKIRYNRQPDLKVKCLTLVILFLQFSGEFGHTFMEFVCNSGDYCQAQHRYYYMF